MNKTRTWLGEISRGQADRKVRQHTWDAQTVEVRADYDTLGVLVLYTQGVVGDWVDLVISDLSLDSLTGPRIHALERELGARVSALEIARTTYGRGHAEIPGSSAFTVIRLSNLGGIAH
jgi:hypothetical protein